jgi:hydroxymethylglutaryl-CoA lyase
MACSRSRSATRLASRIRGRCAHCCESYVSRCRPIDTRGTALANVLAALDLGVTTFDACAGGLGGCPFAPGALGNLATEDLLYMLHGLGLAREIDLDAIVTASASIEPAVGHALPSRYYRAARAAQSRDRAPGGRQ